MLKPSRATIEEWASLLSESCRERIEQVVDKLCAVKEKGGKIAVVTGSGPNIHEGVTTLIAELMRVGVVDGVTTSSAVVAHELGGVLDRVKRVDGKALNIDPALLPRGDGFEFTVMDKAVLEAIGQEIDLDAALLDAGGKADGSEIIKAAGNMAYPMGLWVERWSKQICLEAQEEGVPFEVVAGRFADERTMLGRGARLGLPVLVTIPQLIGGGGAGLAVGDSVSITERALAVADLLGSADVIIESAVALTQEIHDGPFEMHTGHGVWASWDGTPTYSLAEKSLIRIDLDSALEKAWQFERNSQTVQQAIDKGLPKTKLMDIPFRMEMSGFARLDGSLPVIGDIGVIWPVLASRLEERLGLELEFNSAPQQTPEGQRMREWIVNEVAPVTRGLKPVAV